jgi:hypothetical protein
MEFILTEVTTNQEQSVTRECVDRVKGKAYINSLIKKVEQTGESVEVHFEGSYDLKITN